MPGTRTAPLPWFLRSTRGLLAWVAWLAVAFGTTVLLLRHSPRADTYQFRASRHAQCARQAFDLIRFLHGRADADLATADRLAARPVYDREVWRGVRASVGRDELFSKHARLGPEPETGFALAEGELRDLLDVLHASARGQRLAAEASRSYIESHARFEADYRRAAEYPWIAPPAVDPLFP